MLCSTFTNITTIFCVPREIFLPWPTIIVDLEKYSEEKGQSRTQTKFPQPYDEDELLFK